jgi:ABC-type transport system involved in multi-copper enzyme maturation permease subunit
MELVRQPIFLILMSASPAFIIFLSAVPYFGLGDDPKLVKDGSLAVMFLIGLFGSVLCAATSVAHEIRSGTALAVLSKPVGRVVFLMAKYSGVVAALTLLTFVNVLAALMASRMAYDAYGSTDTIGTGIFFGALILAYAMGGFANYFLHRPFVSYCVMMLVILWVGAFFLSSIISKEGEWQKFGTGVDWRLLPASLLILMALIILAGLAVACATRLELIPTMVICSSIFLVGLVSDYFFGRQAEAGHWWASVLYTVAPNWQLFWLADALESGKSIPLGYIAKAVAYMIGYVGAVSAIALVLFEDRELS